MITGEGRLGWTDTLGGKSALFPVAAGLMAIGALGVSDRTTSWALAIGALVPIWLAWRIGIPRAFVRALRHGRPSYRVELDDVGVRQFDPKGTCTAELEWFELERFWPADHGIVLMMRVAKNGANAVFVPRAFFPADSWPRVVALVREKLPSSARANDEMLAATKAQRQHSLPRTLGLWLLLVLLLGGVYWIVRDAP